MFSGIPSLTSDFHQVGTAVKNSSQLSYGLGCVTHFHPLLRSKPEATKTPLAATALHGCQAERSVAAIEHRPTSKGGTGALLAEDGMPLSLSEQQLKIIMTSACG